MSNDWLMLQTNTAQSKISTVSVTFGALPTLASSRRRGRFLGCLATVVAVMLLLGCNSKLTVTTVGGLKKAATQSFKVTALSKIVATPGEILTITGTGFQPSLNLSSVSGLNLADPGSPSSPPKLEVQGGDKATLTLPSSLSFGKYVFTLTQEGESQQITLFSNGGKTDYPIFTSAADEICVGKKFYDETGSLREGTKVCGSVLPDCSEDGAKDCRATTAFAAAATTGLADKVVSGQTVAGVTGNFTAPDPTKVRADNGPFGAAGASLTPTLANCVVDGGTNCVAVADFPAAKLANFSTGDVRTGVTVAGISGALSGAPAACASDGAVGCLSTSIYAAALTTNLAPKVLAGNIVAGVPGSATPESHINCAMDGATSCVAVSSYAAAAISGLANKVLSGSTVAGVAGNVTLPDPTKVRVSNGNFGIGGSGSIPTLADCSSDSGTSCVAVPNFTAAATSGLAGKVVSGNTVAGIPGSATAESHNDCAADGAVGCVAVTNFPAVDKITKLTTGNIKKDVVIAGVTGDYPSSTHPLTGADGTADLPTFATANGGGTYQWFKSDGTRLSGTVEANASVTPSTLSQVLNAGLYRQVTVAGDANLVSNNIKTGTTIFTVSGNVIPTAPPCLIDGGTDCVASPTFTAAATTNLASKVLSGTTVAGTAGNVTLPDPTKVRVSNSSYGIGGNTSVPTLADCSNDGGTTCVAVPNFTAAATSGLAPKVITGNTVAGIAGSATAESHNDCAADGALGCISVAGYTAAATTGLASKVLSTSTVAGIPGNVTMPTIGNVLSGISYGVSGTGSTGTLTLPNVANVRVSNGAFGVGGNSFSPTLADCSADGGTTCVAVSPYTAALTTSLGPKVVSGNTVAGIAGSATAESHSDCSSDGALGCVSVSNYTAAATNGLASKVLSTSTVAGIAGNVNLPTIGNVYSGVQYGVNGTGLTGALTLPTPGNVRAIAGAYGISGTSVIPTLPDCSTDGGIGCVALGPTYAAALTTNLAPKVISGSTVAGVGGNVTLPTIGNVLTGISYGVAGTGLAGTLTLPTAGNVLASSGTYGVSGTGTTPTLTLPDPTKVRVTNGNFGVGGNSSAPTLDDCSADGGLGCVAVGPNYAAALTTGLAPKVVSGNTVAGIAGSATAESHSDCSADGATGCISVASYTAAATSGLGSKVLSTSTVAGIAGNVTLPAQGKVYTGIQYGVSGTALTGTLTLPSASNVISGSPTYGDPSAPLTPSLTSTIYARPGTPTITATAFNFSPDRVTLTWNAVPDASGYLVLMNNSTPVTWTPSDFTTYTSGSAGSDTIAYVGSSTNATIPATITAGTTLYFAVYTYQANQVYSSTPATKAVLSCAGLADGTWVAVPGDTVYGTNGFCVQKYAPSNVGNVATSQTGTTPWVSISQTTAKTQCASLGTGYHLITNPEWMTIAANIANTGSNWSGGSVGSGTLARGHSDNSPASACAADASDANGWVQTTCTGQTQGALAYIERRTRDLSNGNVVWDIGGNVWNWVDYYNLNDKPTPATAAWYEYNAITGSTTTPKSHLVPINSVQNWWTDSWNSSQAIGKIYPAANGAGGALLRGAGWVDGTGAGPFAVILRDAPSYTATSIGFRCAWQP